jgi:hypothetical protein
MSQYDKYVKIAKEIINEEANPDKMLKELKEIKGKLVLKNENGVLNLGYNSDLDIFEILKNSSLTRDGGSLVLKSTEKTITLDKDLSAYLKGKVGE